MLSAVWSGAFSQDYDVYLWIGQSNCAGRGPMTANDTTEVLDGVMLLNADGQPEPAVAPLNRYSNIRKSDMSMQMLGPAWQFAKDMYKANGRKILLVQNARGGSWMQTWQVGGDGKDSYADSAIVRARQALRYGQLKGIMWHQGCTDVQKGTHREIYVERFTKMMRYLREQLGAGTDVPVIVGEIPQWAWADQQEIAIFNDSTLDVITQTVPNCHKVESDGLVRRYDDNVGDPHFSRDSYIELGHRYATELQHMQE